MPPFTILAIADFSGVPPTNLPRLRDRRVIRVDADSLASIQTRLSPQSTVGNEQHPTQQTSVRASWLGLTRLVEATPAREVTVMIWNVAKAELLKDLRRAPATDQSTTYKIIYADGLGTFGGTPIDLIIGDFYLSNRPDDLELTGSLQNLAMIARAPLLCGVSPEFLSSHNWDDAQIPPGHGGVDPSKLWQTISELNSSDYLIPLLPRWRSCARGGEKHWLHPAYLVAALVAGVMKSSDLRELAVNLLPAWSPEAVTDTALFVPMDFFWDAEFEWKYPNSARNNLAALGLNTLSSSTLQGPVQLDAFVSAGQMARPHPSDSLATRLLAGRVFHELQAYVRRVRASDSTSVLEHSIRDWVQSFVQRDVSGNPLFALRHIGVIKDDVIVSLAWHQAVSGALEQLNFRIPRLIDDRPAARLASATRSKSGESS